MLISKEKRKKIQEQIDPNKLHKWGKARRLIDEEKVKIDLTGEDRWLFTVKGSEQEHRVGIDIDTGKGMCDCPPSTTFGKEPQSNICICSHKMACHLILQEIGVERP